MSRTTVVILVSLMTLASVVAFLPAQESSRRTASKFRSPPQASGTEGSGNGISPAPAASSGISDTLSSVPQAPQNLLPGTMPPAELSAAPPSSSADGTAGNNESASAEPSQLSDDSRLHSVLKRNRPAVIYESPAPQTASAQPPAREVAASPSAIAPPPVAPPPTIATRRPSPTASSRVPASTVSAVPRSIQDASITGRSPGLKAEISGPQSVTVGKSVVYLITLTNESEVPADDVQARLLIPAGVAVASNQASGGDAAVHADIATSGRILWSLRRIAPRSQEQLKLELISRQGDPFEVGLEWATKPTIVRAPISVRQPQLETTLAGPAEMTFGEEKVFTLTVSNPGTGDAEHVMITISAGSSPPQQFDAGTISAGHKKELPLAVVASQAGPIDIQVSASAEGGLESRTSGKVTVRKADVSLAISGPPLKFAGTEATYRVIVTNTGTAQADNIEMAVHLPPGAKYVGGIDGATTAGAGLKWKIASLPAGGERVYDLRAVLNTAGSNRVAVHSQAAASGTASSAAETQVEAVADLKLVVNDPAGPLPVGEPAVYELQVMNRGTQAARDVRIVMQFAEGMEPIAFEGCEGRIVPGQLLCQPLAQLAPGQQVSLRIKAQGQQPGSHQFRVEVTSTDNEARLVLEGTSRFFAEGNRNGASGNATRPSLTPPSTPAMLR